MKMVKIAFLILGWLCLCADSTNSPSRIPATKYSTTCPTLNNFNEERRRIRDHLSDFDRPCSCGGPGWTRIASLDMSDPNQQCPANWTLTTSPVRSCGRSSSQTHSCDSVIYPVNGRTYSTVCGRINGYQKGGNIAFYDQNNNINSDYVSGMSITYGAPGSRQHIWTFATAISYNCTAAANDLIRLACPCTNINVHWTNQVPSFIGNDYFCDSGRNSMGGSCYFDTQNVQHHLSDPLWDGQGCPASSTCCGFNFPPWFCKTLPSATSDYLEIRHCQWNTAAHADILVTLMEIYVK